ncbi:hypothetical protein RCO27_18410 [Sphingosinicella sp. LHD-64]|uniref:hypothetical protein n=1 Tax=Sphingosinicella sp. LHD-64 TaxID=3072139 RepID=UPI00280CC5B4|nr:hypothetical protein [Sphingosinicella sp. LHD-64]MDQ8758205.1 hypothetical protein [Sphingosinicella sp. LHD-64]
MGREDDAAQPGTGLLSPRSAFRLRQSLHIKLERRLAAAAWRCRERAAAKRWENGGEAGWLEEMAAMLDAARAALAAAKSDPA